MSLIAWWSALQCVHFGLIREELRQDWHESLRGDHPAQGARIGHRCLDASKGSLFVH